MKKAGRILCLTLVAFILVQIYENLTFQITEEVIASPQIPKGFDDFKIAHVSDLHNKDWGQNLVQAMAKAQPDVILITGDTLDSNRPQEDIALTFVKEMVAIAPVYYVSGNHEIRLGQRWEKASQAFQQAGAHPLDDAFVQLRRGSDQIRLLGVTDPYSEADEVKKVRDTIQGLQAEDGYEILLSHRPELFPTYAKLNVDLVLSGHAHGGQVRLPILGGLIAPNQGFFPNYSEGIHRRQATTMVISRGLGNSIIPWRIANPPELIILTLTHQPME